MAKPKDEPKERGYFNNITFLFEILNKLRTVGEVKLFLSDLLTDSELRMIKKRWHIGCLLYEGIGVRKIALRTKSSTQTVLRVKKSISRGSGGFRLALLRKYNKKRGKVEKKEMKSEAKWAFGVSE